MSRKWTVSADKIRAQPRVNRNCTATTSGKQASSGSVSGARYQIRKNAEDRQRQDEVHHVRQSR